MAANVLTELNTVRFIEKVQKYDYLYNKFSDDYKNKFVRLNCWKKIGDKFGVDAAEAEKKYKNIRTSFCQYLRKKKAIPSGSRREAVPPPAEFANLEWLTNHISHIASIVTNMPSFSVDSDEEDEPDVEIEEENNIEHMVVNDEEFENPGTETESPESIPSPSTSDSPAQTEKQLSANSALNTPKGCTKRKPRSARNNKSMGTCTTSKPKRPWSANGMKSSKEDVDLTLLKTATTLAEKVMQTSEPEKKRRLEEIEDEDSLFCRCLAQRLKRLHPRTKGFVRLQIEQLMYPAVFAGQPALPTPNQPSLSHQPTADYPMPTHSLYSQPHAAPDYASSDHTFSQQQPF